MDKRLINLKNITKTYNGKKIFSKVSFDILECRNVGFLGLNGSGKSTLLKIIANLEKQDSGEI
jgi:ATP-binding cassette subfamily F protein uup